MFDVSRQDVRYALRSLRRSPHFTAIVILTLALGVGANTAVFSVIRQVLLKALDVVRPEELVEIGCLNTTSFDSDCNVSYQGFRVYQSNRDVLDGLFAYWAAGEMHVARDGQSEIVTGLLASGDMYAVLGLQPHTGRLLNADDDRPGAAAVVVLGYDYWRRAFGEDPAVIGRPLRVGDELVTIAGVTPPSFRGVALGFVPDVTFPLSAATRVRYPQALVNGGDTFLKLIGRRKPGVKDDQIRAALTPEFEENKALLLRSLPPDLAAGVRTMVGSYRFLVRPARLGGSSPFRDDLQLPLRAVAAVVAGVLLIACANLAALLIARVAGRRHELAVRLALGGTTLRLTRQLITEVAVLAVAGTLGALVTAVWIVPPFVRLLAGEGALRAVDVTVDAATLAFAAGASIGCVLLIALGAALHTSRVGAAEVTHAARGSERMPRSSRVLLAGQCALTLLLLVTAGLFVRTLVNLERFDVGFASEGRVVATLRPGLARYDPARTQAYIDRAIAALATQPGVGPVTYSRYEMGALSTTTIVTLPGFEQAASAQRMVGLNRVGPRFVETAGLTLLTGRDIEGRDASAATPGAVVNESFARHFFGTPNALGRQIRLPETGSPSYAIVGVVRDARDRGVTGVMERVAYLAYAPGSDVRSIAITAVVDQPASSAVAMMARTLAAVDPNVPVQRADTLSARLGEALRRQRVIGTLSVVLGTLASLLVALGLYAMVAGAVARRRAEIAIRMALGATASGVAWIFTRETFVGLGVGLAAGLVSALLAMRTIHSLLFGIEPTDIWSLASAVGALLVAAALGLLVPLRRAMRVDPAATLRAQ